jgi:hypothetical protein
VLSELQVRVLFLLFGRSEAGASFDVGDGDGGFPWVGEHAVLLELQIGKESVASYPAYYSKSFYLAVPLGELDEFLQNAFDR